jgi:hypothetical protein
MARLATDHGFTGVKLSRCGKQESGIAVLMPYLTAYSAV